MKTKTLGQYIREKRDEKDLSLRELSKNIDCSPAFLSDIELGKRNPSEEVFVRIAKELGVSISELKQFDTRPPTEDVRRLSNNPKYALAFRAVVEKASQKELIEFAKKLEKNKPRGKNENL